MFALALPNPAFDFEAGHPPKLLAIVGDERKVFAQSVRGDQHVFFTDGCSSPLQVRSYRAVDSSSASWPIEHSYARKKGQQGRLAAQLKL